jgi:16S rRNA (uracil1498-N3)-methyltransferase
MLRVYSGIWDGGDCLPELDKEEARHLLRVRRARPGEPVEVLNGRGHVGQAQLENGVAGSPRLRLVASRSVEPPPLRVHLLVALPKGKVFPALLAKAVELGASAITPLITEHVEAAPDRAGQKRERWEGVLVEALKQSGNPWLPVLHPPAPLQRCLDNPAGGAVQRLCAALQPDAVPLWRLLGDSLPAAGTIEVYVGPEGDFSPAEYQLLRAAGCAFASLGPLVLKVETAASLVLGVLQTRAIAQAPVI